MLWRRPNIGLVVVIGLSMAPSPEATAQERAAASEPPAGQADPTGDADALTEQESRLFGGRLLREGAFLTEATGTLQTLSTGAWAFVFERGRSVDLPPMVVMPSMTLAAMEQVVESRDSEVRLVVSGQVFVYRGRNYLLPTTHAVAPSVEAKAPVPQGAAAGDEPPGGEDPPPPALEDGRDEVEVDDLLRELEESTPQQRAMAPAPGPGATSPGLLREGTLQRLRRGRVVRHDGGGLDFIPEATPDAPTRADPILTLLPCQNLEAIESVITRPGATPAFLLSGRVFVYEGRNYLLPTMYVVDFDPSGNLVGR